MRPFHLECRGDCFCGVEWFEASAEEAGILSLVNVNSAPTRVESSSSGMPFYFVAQFAYMCLCCDGDGRCSTLGGTI